MAKDGTPHDPLRALADAVQLVNDALDAQARSLERLGQGLDGIVDTHVAVEAERAASKALGRIPPSPEVVREQRRRASRD